MNRLSLIAAGTALVLAACGGASTPTPSTASGRGGTTAVATAAASVDHTDHTATAATGTSPAATTAGAPAATSAATIAPAAATANPNVAAAPTLPPTAAPIVPEATAAPATAAPATAAPVSGTVVTVTLVDTGIRLSRTSAPAGPVTFTVTNAGTVQHEFVVLQTTIAQGQIPVDPAQPALVQEPGFLGKVSALAPGASGSITLTLGRGSYVVICNELAHYMIGMHAAFTAN